MLKFTMIITNVISNKFHQIIRRLCLRSNNERLIGYWAMKNITKDGIRSASNSRLIFQQFKDRYPNLAIKYGKLAIDTYFDPSFNAVYANRLRKLGKDHEAQIIEDKLTNLDKIKPNKSNVDVVYKTLSKHRDALNALKWHKFLVLLDPNSKPISSRKFFIYFKDIDAELSCELGSDYVLAHPSDIKFAEVFLKRAVSTLNASNFRSLCFELSSKSDERLYSLYIMQFKIEEMIEKHGEQIGSLDEIELTLNTEQDIKRFLQFAFMACKDKYSPLNQYVAEKLTKHILDCRWSRKLSDYYLSIGSIQKAKFVIENAESSALVLRKKNSINSFSKLYKYGFKGSSISPPQKNYTPSKSGVLYLLHNRLPYNSGGYATRSHGILTSIDKKWNIQGVSRLGYPQDREGFENEDFINYHDIDGVRYHALRSDGNAFGQIPLYDYITEYSISLKEKCFIERPSIIHAASNYMNGLAAVKIAKELGIASVYEVRGLWEITRISREPEWKDSEYYQMMVNLEAQAAKNADAVFTLTNALKNELVSRGVAAEKIHLLPNGVDSSRFVPKPRNHELASKLGLEDKIIIGFLGSVVQYEGVEYIIQAASILRQQGISNFAVLIVGDGAVIDNVKKITSELNMTDYVTFTGRVPHDEIEDYYSIVDICPLPRKGLPVCEMVSPLKPFEAMAMGKVVVSSDVAALAEIIDDGVTGLLHKKDDPEDLARKISELIMDPDLRTRLGQAAREWVVAERDWKVIAKRVDNVYRNLLGQ